MHVSAHHRRTLDWTSARTEPAEQAGVTDCSRSRTVILSHIVSYMPHSRRIKRNGYRPLPLISGAVFPSQKAGSLPICPSRKSPYCMERPPAKQAQARPRRREGEMVGAGCGSDRSTSTRLARLACEAGAAASAAASAATPAPAAGLTPTAPAPLVPGATAAAAAGGRLPRAAIARSAPGLPAAAPTTAAAGTPSGMAGRWVLEEGLVRPLRSRLRGTGGESARRRRRRMEARSRLMLRGRACESVCCAELMWTVNVYSAPEMLPLSYRHSSSCAQERATPATSCPCSCPSSQRAPAQQPTS